MTRTNNAYNHWLDLSMSESQLILAASLLTIEHVQRHLGDGDTLTPEESNLFHEAARLLTNITAAAPPARPSPFETLHTIEALLIRRRRAFPDADEILVDVRRTITEMHENDQVKSRRA